MDYKKKTKEINIVMSELRAMYPRKTEAIIMATVINQIKKVLDRLNYAVENCGLSVQQFVYLLEQAQRPKHKFKKGGINYGK